MLDSVDSDIDKAMPTGKKSKGPDKEEMAMMDDIMNDDMDLESKEKPMAVK